MNRTRRNSLKQVMSKLDQLESIRSEVQELLEAIRDEEQEAYDNLPESFQDSEKGETMQGFIDVMEEVLYTLEELDVEEMNSQLEEIVGG